MESSETSTARALQTQLDLSDVTVIIVTFESAHCIATLAQFLKYCPRVIVVDNGSDDGTPAEVSRLLPHARFIGLEQNIGFGAANNRALEEVTTRFALLLNPDCEISERSMRDLVAAAQRFPDAAIIAPQLINRRGERELSYRWPSTLWRSTGPAASGPACVGFVSGAVMLLHLEKMGHANRFDERFFLYYEDDDLCTRNFNARQPIIVVPSITVTHRSRGSVRGKAPLKGDYLRGFHHIQSKLRFIELHKSGSLARQLRRRYLVIALLAAPLRLAAFSPRLIARWAGRIHGLATWRPLSKVSGRNKTPTRPI